MSIQGDLQKASQALLEGRHDECDDLCGRARDLARAEGDRVLVADALNLLGQCLHDQLRHADARPLLEEALSIRSELLGPDHLATAHSRSSLAATAWALDLGPEARRLAARALAAVPEDPPPEDRLLCVQILKGVAVVERALVDMKVGIDLLHRALALVEAPPAQDPLEITSVLMLLGVSEEMADDLPRARSCLERALSIRQQVLGESHMKVALGHFFIARIMIKEGDLDGAAQTATLALGMLERCAGPEHIDVAATIAMLAMIAATQGDLSRALEMAGRALSIQTRFFGSETPQLAPVRHLLGMIHDRREEHALAEAHFRAAVASLLPVLPIQGDLLVTCLASLLLCLHAQGKLREIPELIEPVVARWGEVPDAALGALPTLLDMAMLACLQLDELAQGERILAKAGSAVEARFGEQSPVLEPILVSLGRLLPAMGKHAEAEAAARRLDEIQSKHDLN